MPIKIDIEASAAVKGYYDSVAAEVEKQLSVAAGAKSRGFDVSTAIETRPVADLADRTETIIGPPGIAKRYREVFEEKKGNRMDAIFQIFREIIEQQWCKIEDDQKRVEQAIKTSLVLNTEGVVVAPLDGVPEIKISRNPDGSKYINVYYAGPIRAAGGTSAVLPLILGDYAKQLLGLDRFKPTEDEVERYVEECQIYEEIVSRQYRLSEAEVKKIVRGCTVCINGEPTEEREVAVHRNLPRIESNRVRGGMCLVISEGVALKAPKILQFSKQLGLDWSWLEGIIKVGKSESGERKIEPNEKFLEGAAAGRPIFCYPERIGGFRLRYGKARNTGIMGKGIHPATMFLLDEFVAVATQLKVERPGKAAGIFPVDSIEGPTVKLLNGCVVKVKSLQQAIELKPRIAQILFLGDILVSVGDFRHSAHPLVPAGYCAEWWAKELQRQLRKIPVEKEQFEEIIAQPENVSIEQAIELSEKFNAPLHPNALYYYDALDKNELVQLINFLKEGKELKENKKIAGIELPKQEAEKQLMEKIGVPHKVEADKIIIEAGDALALTKTLALQKNSAEIAGIIEKSADAIDALNNLSGLAIRGLCGTFVGSRMGRPEASRPRKMIGNPHVLFPIGLHGGNTRSINKAMASEAEGSPGKILVEIALFKCSECRQIREQPFCPACGKRAEKISQCPKCGSISATEKCGKCGAIASRFSKREIDLGLTMQQAAQNLGIKVPELVKGVKGTINKDRVTEPLEKGLLRAKHDMHIFRDATIRYELINAPLTHFTAAEIGISIARLRELGYSKDSEGKELENERQLVELMPQDIIIHEQAGEFFAKETKFIDELLQRFYKMQPFFNANKKEDLVGQLLLGLAPHTSAAIVGRVIGFTKARCCFQHPFFMQTKRRNCLRGNTPILIENEGELKSIQIGQLDNGTNQKIIPIEKKLALTIAGNGEIKREKITGLFKRRASRKIFRIRTAGGRELEATADHKMLVWDNGIKVRKVRCLKKGQLLLSLAQLDASNELKQLNCLQHYLSKPVEEKKKLRAHGCKEILAKKIKENGYSKTAKEINYRSGKAIHTGVSFDSIPLDLFELLMKRFSLKEEQLNSITIGYAKQKSRITKTIALDEKLGLLLGYFYGDGWARTTFRKGREKFVYQVGFVSKEKSTAKRLNKTIAQVFHRKPTIEEKGNCNIITLSGRVFYDFFTEMLLTGKSAKTKHLSEKVLNAPKKFITAMLAGYFSSDGSVDYNAIKVCSVNKQLINQMGIACTRIGVYPHFFEEKKTIRSGTLMQFYKKPIKSRLFGFRIYSKDLLPFKGMLLGKRNKKLLKTIRKTNITKKKTRKIGNFALNKIKHIEKMPCKDKFVYDLIVEGSKTFIAGHGSLAVFDCDGDQDSLLLLMDALLNFSHSYLPSSRGGRMDAPLVFTIALKPTEIDDECYQMEKCSSYPLELYEMAQKIMPPEVSGIERVKDSLGKQSQYDGFGCTHSTSQFDAGPTTSKYVALGTMEEKLRAQAKLQGKIAACDAKDALERVMVSHLLPDIIGNTRAFSRQQFRCTACNAKMRRIPLDGKCVQCGKTSVILTIAQGSVRKYLLIAKALAEEYQLNDYLRQRLELAGREIDSIFQNDQKEQKKLAEFV